jgi:hypothetical protein
MRENRCEQIDVGEDVVVEDAEHIDGSEDGGWLRMVRKTEVLWKMVVGRNREKTQREGERRKMKERRFSKKINFAPAFYWKLRK